MAGAREHREVQIEEAVYGPLLLKNTNGKTLVLDIGALEKIKNGEINVVPRVKRFLSGNIELVDGRILEIDSVTFATKYRSKVPSWLQGSDFFSKDGLPKQQFPNYGSAWLGGKSPGFDLQVHNDMSLCSLGIDFDFKDESSKCICLLPPPPHQYQHFQPSSVREGERLSNDDYNDKYGVIF